MNLGDIFRAQLWPPRKYAWPLLVVTVPMYVVLFLVAHPLRAGRIGLNWHVHEFCMFLSRTPIVWALAAVWFAMDVGLVVWMDRALNRDGEPARPARSFLMWQFTKLAFLFLFFSVLIAHGPLDHTILEHPTFE
ncbi:MAG: hypothetical protein JW889_04910 [Verrucomicrobia bacterium]|nr:hypothetical protein [Verrucomicrobiota bacterium]